MFQTSEEIFDSHYFDKFYLLRAQAIQKIRMSAYEEALADICSAMTFAHKERMPPFYVDPVIDEAFLQIADWLGKQLPGKAWKKSDSRIRVAYIIPYLADHMSFTSIFLGFLFLHDPERFQIKAYSTEMLEDNRGGSGVAGFSSRLAPRSIQKIREAAVPISFLQADFRLLDKTRTLYRQIQNDQIDIAVIFGVPWDVVSLLTGILKPAKFIYFHFGHHALNLVPYRFDYHADFTTVDRERCSPHIEKERELTLIGGCPEITPLEAAVAAPYAKKDLGVEEDTLLMGTFGSIHKLSPFQDPDPKNVLFFQTIKKIMEVVPNLRYVLAGPNPGINLQELLAKTVGPGFMQRIHYLGVRQDIPRLVGALDLYLNSFPVGGGCSVREAMAAGVSVITMNQRWDDEYHIPTSDVGFEEATCNTPEEFAEKAIYFLSSQQERKQLGEKLKKRFKENLDPQKKIREWEDCLLRVAAEA